MTAQQAMDLLASESALREGVVPDSLPDPIRRVATFELASDAFLLRLPSGLRFHYRKGQGVVMQRPAGVDDLEVAVFLNGSVYGAIAWLNGLVPLHASGVVHDGRVYAFTGNSGAGKSTLVMALAAQGMPLMADDVLVLDLSDPTAVMCLPGHKKVKLWPDAVDLTEAAVTGPVRPEIEKVYAAPKAGYYPDPLPLAEVLFLDDTQRTATAITMLTGAERFTQAEAAFYRPHFCTLMEDKAGIFKVLARLASQVRFGTFNRPHDKAQFGMGVAAMAAHIRGS
jgi:hypothetical protein